MAQYIEKAKVVKEILSRRNAIPEGSKNWSFRIAYEVEAYVLTKILEYIDSLEVKEI